MLESCATCRPQAIGSVGNLEGNQQGGFRENETNRKKQIKELLNLNLYMAYRHNIFKFIHGLSA